MVWGHFGIDSSRVIDATTLDEDDKVMDYEGWEILGWTGGCSGRDVCVPGKVPGAKFAPYLVTCLGTTLPTLIGWIEFDASFFPSRYRYFGNTL